MDARRGLTDREADRKLRDLFARTGPLEAPEGMDARILNALAAERSPQRDVPPLLPRWVWPVAGASLLVLLILPFFAAGAQSVPAGALDLLLERIAHSRLSAMTARPWFRYGTLAAVLLLGMELWLSKPRKAVS